MHVDGSLPYGAHEWSQGGQRNAGHAHDILPLARFEAAERQALLFLSVPMTGDGRCRSDAEKLVRYLITLKYR